jgi:hypothetical protein
MTLRQTRAALRTVSHRETLAFMLPVAFSCLAFAFASVFLVGIGR